MEGWRHRRVMISDENTDLPPPPTPPPDMSPFAPAMDAPFSSERSKWSKLKEGFARLECDTTCTVGPAD
jgi:hypothetical protein